MISSAVFIAEGRTSKGKGPQPLETLEMMASDISWNMSAVRCLQLFTSITLILTLSLSEKRYHAHFIDEKSEVQR